MANEVKIARKSDASYSTDLGPVGTFEETLVKAPWAAANPRPPGSANNPETIIVDTKSTTHKLVITGDLTTVDGVAPETKRTNLKTLYGFGSNSSTFVTVTYTKIGGSTETIDGLITRFTVIRKGGENFYEYILEVTVGVAYTDATIG